MIVGTSESGLWKQVKTTWRRLAATSPCICAKDVARCFHCVRPNWRVCWPLPKKRRMNTCWATRVFQSKLWHLWHHFFTNSFVFGQAATVRKLQAGHGWHGSKVDPRWRSWPKLAVRRHWERHNVKMEMKLTRCGVHLPSLPSFCIGIVGVIMRYPLSCVPLWGLSRLSTSTVRSVSRC